MNFKVGQRVKKALHGGFVRVTIPIGTQGTIIEPSPVRDWRIAWDGYGTHDSDGTRFASYEWQIVPAVDPHAEQFMEWIRALDKAPIRELQPDEMERVRG